MFDLVWKAEDGESQAYCRASCPGFLNDQLWVDAMSTHCYQSKVRWGHEGLNPLEDEQKIFTLLQRGLVDQEEDDKPWPAVTRAIRYSAVLGDRLLAVIEREKDRVRIIVFHLGFAY